MPAKEFYYILFRAYKAGRIIMKMNKANANSGKSIKNCLNGFADIEKSKSKPNQRLIEGFMKLAEKL